MVVRTRIVTAMVALAALLVVLVGGRVAGIQGAFGCSYKDREHTVALTLAENSPVVRVRIGEGISLHEPVGGLRDVVAEGSAGLAPGTENGIRDHVFRVTTTGESVIKGMTADGHRVSGRVSAHC
jgi:hypothetical protein